MALNIAGEVDPVLRTAVKVLHSQSQSGEKIRLMLDDLIKVQFVLHTIWAMCDICSAITPFVVDVNS